MLCRSMVYKGYRVYNHSRVSFAARSFGAGDVSTLPLQAAAHFIAAFELMDLSGWLRVGSRENSISIDDNDNEGPASRYSDSLNNTSQLFAEERLGIHGENPRNVRLDIQPRSHLCLL
jgi:hypothetical protein